MASEIRVNQIQNRSGLGTVTFSDTGAVFSGVTTISDLRTSGTSVVAAGTTAAPSISPTGDSNTGIFFPSADTIAFAEGGVEAARIDSSGRLGIGLTNPSTDSSGIHLRNDSLSNTRELLRLTNSGGGVSDGVKITFEVANTSGGGGNISVVRNSGSLLPDMLFSTSSTLTGAPTERARFNSTGAFVLAGGSTSANGIGIAFPATQSASTDANTLDDYEEGTWTPEIWVGSTQQTLSRADGSYVKIGQIVSVQISTILSGAVSGSGVVQLRNLPFTHGSYGPSTHARGVLSIGYTNAGIMPCACLLNQSTTTGDFFFPSGTTNLLNQNTQLTGASLISGWNCHFAGSYRV